MSPNGEYGTLRFGLSVPANAAEPRHLSAVPAWNKAYPFSCRVSTSSSGSLGVENGNDCAAGTQGIPPCNETGSVVDRSAAGVEFSTGSTA